MVRRTHPTCLPAPAEACGYLGFLNSKLENRKLKTGNHTYMLQEFINQLKESAEHRDILSHYHYLPEKPVEYAVGDAGLSPMVLAALERLGIPRLYSHQGEALAAIRAGKHLLVATPTASGKTLIYNLPVLEALLAEPRGHALYLFPLKALEQDQLKALQELDAALPSPTLTAAIYDGDTPPAAAPGHQGAPAACAHHQPGHAPHGAYALPRLVVRLLCPAQVRGDR